MHPSQGLRSLASWRRPGFCLRPGAFGDVVGAPSEKTVMFLNVLFSRETAVPSGMSDESERRSPLRRGVLPRWQPPGRTEHLETPHFRSCPPTHTHSSDGEGGRTGARRKPRGPLRRMGLSVPPHLHFFLIVLCFSYEKEFCPRRIWVN